MSEYLLEQTPTKIITARRLWELVKENAILLPLFHQLGDLQAYRVDAQGGPYLMTAYEVSLYRDKFKTRPYPLVRQP
jgi:hypothetical protein